MKVTRRQGLLAVAALAATVFAGAAHAGGVQWSIGINLPAVYGPPPVMYAPAPVYVQPPPVVYGPPPVYVVRQPQVVYAPQPVRGWYPPAGQVVYERGYEQGYERPHHHHHRGGDEWRGFRGVPYGRY
ncbi:MAG: hypothetical protein ABI574_06560 [Burkholderiales bacterium]